MKLVYSLLLALFLSIGAQAQNCIWSVNTLANNTVIVTPPVGMVTPQYYVQWNFDDGTVIHAGDVPITHVYANPGMYIICMSIIDSMTGPVCTYCDTTLISSCTISYTQTGTSFAFTANGSNPNSNVIWSFGDGTSGNGQTVTHPYNGVGNYTNVSTQAGSTCSISYGQPNPVTAPGTYNFVGSAGVNPNLIWDFGDGTIGAGPSVSHTYSASGTYTVCMTSYTLLDTCVTCQNITVTLTPPSCSFAAFPDSVNSSQMYFNAWGVFVNNIINWTYGDGTSGTGQFCH